MRALFYLTKRSFINNLKKAVRKPTTLIALILGAAYAVFVAFSLVTLAVGIRMDSVQGLVIIVTIWTIYITLGNFMAYSGRKGVIFRPAHAHFVFTAPISPKLVLVGSSWMNYLTSAIVFLVLSIGGLTVFQVPVWRVVLFLLVGCGVEVALELCIMVFLYTNDHLPEKLMSGIRMGIKVFLIAFTLAIVLYFRRNGFSVESALNFIDWPVLRMIPVIGWQVAVYRLILLGPDTLNIICTVLYAAVFVIFAAGVLRMKCDGGYYEEAAKFADDYAEIRQRQQNGEMVTGLSGKKRRFRRVKEKITGRGARAVFYRQLLEYKKEKFFIFSKMTLICAVIALIFSYSFREAVDETGRPEFFLLGIVAYVSLIMSGYLGKWESELSSPYLFLIPDSPFKKLWYATAMEHIKALADGCVICIPIGIFWQIHPLYIVLCILAFVVIQADRLYTKVIAQCLLGDVFGKTGQNMLRMVIQMFLLGLGAGAAALAGVFINPGLVFPIVLIYCMIITVAMGALASLRFETMEQLV